MRPKLLLVLLVVLATSPVLAATVTLYDFEGGTEGWAVEWGLKHPPTNSVGRARQGDSSLFFTHEFKKSQESIGVRVVFNEPMDYAAQDGFAGFSAWVYFPRGQGWEAQIYYHAGDNWEWQFGPLYSNLQPGWNQIQFTRKQMSNIVMRDLGIQIKNYKLNAPCDVFIDRIEAIYSGSSPMVTSRK